MTKENIESLNKNIRICKAYLKKVCQIRSGGGAGAAEGKPRFYYLDNKFYGVSSNASTCIDALLILFRTNEPFLREVALT